MSRIAAPTTKIKTLAPIALIGAAALTVSACGSGNWEQELRAEIRSDSETMMTQEDCEGMALMGIDSPEAAVDFAGAFVDMDAPMSEVDDIADVTDGLLTDTEGSDLDVPGDVTIGELILVGFDEAMSACDWEAAAAATSFEDLGGDTEWADEDPYGETVETVWQASIGEEFQTGDWLVTVTDVNLNAGPRAQELGYDLPNIGGFMTVEYDATYTGSDSALIDQINFEFIGSDGLVYDQGVWMIGDGVGACEPCEATNGGSLSHTAWVEVDPAATDSGVITIDGDVEILV